MRHPVLILVNLAAAFGADHTLLWRDPGPIGSLDLAAGPGGSENAPKPPFTFVEEEKSGVTPKAVITDGRQKKWMVKFGEEAKAETFASRLAWAAGYPVRASYYVAKGRIEGARDLSRLKSVIQPDGTFRDARFQVFDHDNFKQVDGKFNLYDKRDDQRELNGLKLTLLLTANWDVKPGNLGVFEINGQRFAAVTDWGASMGDPASPPVTDRKWNCEKFNKRTETLIDGIDNGYVQFNYIHYTARHEHAISSGIRVEDVKWYMDRLGQLTDQQLRAGLVASGANPQEADCFTAALRKRLHVFGTVAQGGQPEGVRTIRTVTKTTTKTTP